MHFRTLVISLASAAVLVSALPNNLVARGGKDDGGWGKGDNGDGGYGKGGNGNNNVCQGGSVYCCNSVQEGGSLKARGGGLLGLGDILGGLQCSGILDILDNQCTSQTVCCNGDHSSGLINVSCTNINL